LGEFSPIVRFFSLTVFFNAEEVQLFGLLFSTEKVMYVGINFDKKWGWLHFGRFFTNSSGRPDPTPPKRDWPSAITIEVGNDTFVGEKWLISQRIQYYDVSLLSTKIVFAEPFWEQFTILIAKFSKEVAKLSK
jgi:hypothetical protein